MSGSQKSFNALIRTHHITSRKKVTKLRQAADLHNVFVLLRTGGSPGMMYVEGRNVGVHEWIAVVQKLRYKDYQLAARPDQVVLERATTEVQPTNNSHGLSEVSTVKEFSQEMARRGVFEWWRAAMGYAQGQSDRL
ncbi:hypothetical protein AMS68_007994 [Peltaster fructicola]|uniref:Uncharacterized protein n=1 Tax=Peltaster fructicola TaxID=286661 RepID=A0A6H0Y5Z5_9PEZI|nr:hypothetical protein AMS68_007994 [Peltaster fructicola]